MSDLLFLTDTIDAVEMNSSFEPVPAGTYVVNIVGSSTKATKNGSGTYLELVLEIANGPHTGRKFWERLNVQNQNAQTQEIAQKALKTLKELCGIDRLTSSEQFLGYQVPVQVTLKPRKDAPDVLENQLRFNPPKQAGEQPTSRPAAPGAAVSPAVAASAGAKQPAWAQRRAS